MKRSRIKEMEEREGWLRKERIVSLLCCVYVFVRIKDEMFQCVIGCKWWTTTQERAASSHF